MRVIGCAAGRASAIVFIERRFVAAIPTEYFQRLPAVRTAFRTVGIQLSAIAVRTNRKVAFPAADDGDLKEFTTEGTYTVRVQITELPEGCTYIGEATMQIILTKK